MQHDEKYGAFWKMLHDEFQLTKKYVLKLSNTKKLMENYPVERESILAREKIILPLLIIQHYAIRKQKNLNLEDDKYDVYSKLIARTIYGVVNAGRNLA